MAGEQCFFALAFVILAVSIGNCALEWHLQSLRAGPCSHSKKSCLFNISFKTAQECKEEQLHFRWGLLAAFPPLPRGGALHQTCICRASRVPSYLSRWHCLPETTLNHVGSPVSPLAAACLGAVFWCRLTACVGRAGDGWLAAVYSMIQTSISLVKASNPNLSYRQATEHLRSVLRSVQSMGGY